MRFPVILLAFALTACTSGPAPDDRSPDGSPAEAVALKPAPEFDLVSLAGGSIRSEELKGKVLVVDFWATWCEPCIREIPNYNALRTEHDGGNFEILGVTMQSGDLEDVEPFIDDLGIEYPVVMGTNDVAAGFGGVTGYPWTFVVSPDWEIYRTYRGNTSGKKEQIEQDIMELTSNPDSPSS